MSSKFLCITGIACASSRKDSSRHSRREREDRIAEDGAGRGGGQDTRASGAREGNFDLGGRQK